MNQMDILELKNLIRNQNSMVGHNSRMERREKRTSELKDRTIEITQSEHQRENRLEKKGRESQGPVGL